MFKMRLQFQDDEARALLDPDKFVTRQVFYESRDKTRIPLFIVHKIVSTATKNRKFNK
jgi:prolyl oligopeptidase PreP (S9A serine peptidase family)